MTRYMYVAVALGLISAGIPLRAANGPHAATERQSKVLWTNDNLDKLHYRAAISIVGPEGSGQSAPAPWPAPYVKTQDPNWYAAQAANLRAELEYRQTQLREYQQSLSDARSLEESTGGIYLVDDDFAITPEAGIEILKQRVAEVQVRLDDLGDLARRNDIEPGTLRGQ